MFIKRKNNIKENIHLNSRYQRMSQNYDQLIKLIYKNKEIYKYFQNSTEIPNLLVKKENIENNNSKDLN